MKELDSNDKQLLSRALSRVQAANETLQFLSDWFRDKYGLTPANQITPDGKIIDTQTGTTFDESNNGSISLDVPSLQS